MPAFLRPARILMLSICLSSAATAAGFAPAALADNAGKPVMAVAGFDFRDTSGEIRDQSAEHEARLNDVASTLLEGLSESGNFEPIALNCQNGCSARTAGLEALSRKAGAIEADYLLVGEVHKMSTLVGWMKFAVLDLAEKKPVCDRFLTYRGDTDEAWHRAAEFVVRDIERHCVP